MTTGMNDELGDGKVLKLPFNIGNGRNFFTESNGKPSIELKLYRKSLADPSKFAQQKKLNKADSENSTTQVDESIGTPSVENKRLGLLGRVCFHKSAEGPPGHAHGGALAYVLDEAMGGTAWAFLYPVVAASLSFSYKAMSPLDEVFEIETHIHKIDLSLVISGVVRRLDGQILVEAKSEFAILRRSKIDKLMSAVGPLDQSFDIDLLHWAEEKPKTNNEKPK